VQGDVNNVNVVVIVVETVTARKQALSTTLELVDDLSSKLGWKREALILKRRCSSTRALSPRLTTSDASLEAATVKNHHHNLNE
jgi:hypothetical protein